ESIRRAALKHGLFPDAVGREDDWMKFHLSRGDDKGAQFAVEMSNGHWVQIIEQETPQGGRVAVLSDITEPLMSRKRAKVAEQRLRDAIDALPVGFWLFDKDDRLVMFNTVSGIKLPGQRRDLEPGRELAELVRRRMAIAEEIRIGGVVTHDTELAYETLRNETSELEARYDGGLWFKYYTRRTSEGGLVMFRIEITDLRLHQYQLEASNAELRAALAERDAAESRFRDVADISSEWFWEQDEAMCLTYLSEGFARVIGRDPAEFIGQLSPDAMISGDSGGGVSLHDKMQAHEPFSDVIYNYKFHGDKESWIRTNGKPVFTKDGKFRGYIGTAEDVTLFYAALREAEKADEAKTQFLNVISHELRTPLTSVLGFNSFIANAVKLPSYIALQKALEAGDPAEARQRFDVYQQQIKDFAERIRCAGIQLQSLIDDMLDLARIEANTIRLDLTRVDSLRVVTSVVDQMQALAAEKALELRVQVTDLPVLADEIRFRQILTNLLGNALKFTEKGRITIENERQGDLVVFRVKDTGIGIAPDRLPIIFDRFAQAEMGTGTTRKNSGVGLGLAICKDLVRLQNGWIKAESTLGEGATLTFALPAAPEV
ncbi:MAG: ATP-binding protein, partial [Paracoccaceae bacterium]|nr:ATP-binding protein [Paracoccaceae bacterium]